MHNVFYFLIVLAQGGIVYLLYCLLDEVRRARHSIENPPPNNINFHSLTKTVLTTHFALPRNSAYAIWTWRGNHWELEVGTVPPGHEPAGPPPHNGSYTGQRIKTECVRC